MPRRWLNAKAHQKQSHFTSGRRSGVKNVCAKYFVSYKPTIIVETILHDQVFQEVSLKYSSVSSLFVLIEKAS